MQRRRLGNSEIAVSAIGFGCMGLSELVARADDLEGRLAIRRALECGITHFDTADLYGSGANEALIGDELRRVRRDVVIATKCGIVRDAAGMRFNGTPAYLRAACDASLARLKTDYVDVLYLHRVDPAVPVEESVGAMADLVRQGKARCLGLSKVYAATLRRAAAVHPIVAVQMKYSVCTRYVEVELLQACRTMDVAVVAYSPLSRGVVTQRIMSPDALHRRDRRRADARFQGEGLTHSQSTFRMLQSHAAHHGCTPPQLALAWLLSRGSDVIPIPGMRTRSHVDENIRAVDLVLSHDTHAALERLAPPAQTSAPAATGTW